VTRNSMILSRRAGILTSAGIALGVLVHVAYSLAGIGLIISQSILLFNAIKLIGAAYLVYLGVSMLCAERKPKGTQKTASAPMRDFEALRIGFLTNALNPKTTLFVVSLFTQVVSPTTPFTTQLGYGAFMSLAHLVWFAFVSCAFSSQAARQFVDNSRHYIERTIGGILVTLGVALAASSLKRA
jgi:RhtB (resistance to homoserine/threonine) family protein